MRQQASLEEIRHKEGALFQINTHHHHTSAAALTLTLRCSACCELELELTHTHMTQKPLLRVEVGAHAVQRKLRSAEDAMVISVLGFELRCAAGAIRVQLIPRFRTGITTLLYSSRRTLTHRPSSVKQRDGTRWHYLNSSGSCGRSVLAARCSRIARFLALALCSDIGL